MAKGSGGSRGNVGAVRSAFRNRSFGSAALGRVAASELQRGDTVFVPNFGAVRILGRTRAGGYRAESAGADWMGRRQRGVIQSSRFVGARIARGNRYYNVGG